MVENEENIAREEYDVVKKVHEEVSDTVFKNNVLETCVWRGYSITSFVFDVYNCITCHEDYRGAVSQRGETTRSFCSLFRTPVAENHHESKDIQERKHDEECWQV
ncbi:hypothetical protein Ddye_031492 [Dipteronia dyeriana]|uniref:Uncharacterized protein n=1 Tax=Dipteronia dyeriana TaxID=168575 RepID=A0AAD9TJK9_9ROSI|nr:hypothetical protein Ddye_031492 [Dipteronia dyeriana]